MKKLLVMFWRLIWRLACVHLGVGKFEVSGKNEEGNKYLIVKWELRGPMRSLFKLGYVYVAADFPPGSWLCINEDLVQGKKKIMGKSVFICCKPSLIYPQAQIPESVILAARAGLVSWVGMFASTWRKSDWSSIIYV